MAASPLVFDQNAGNAESSGGSLRVFAPVKPKILLIGRNGQVGSDLGASLPKLAETIALDRQHLDLSNPREIRQTIRQIRPSFIVNAAAYTAVDQAETDQTTVRSINAEAPGIIAEEARQIGAGLVHYSTDYVFDGTKNTPYEEADSPNPLSVYGQTKLAGETAIRDTGVPHLLFRTAWVYSTRGRNFLLTVLRLATQREELRIVRDQFGAPTSSREIAQTTANILELISQQREGTFDLSGFSGTYHLTAAGVTTWYDFATAILEESSQMSAAPAWFASATNGLPIKARRIVPIRTEEYPTPARRPSYSVLSNSRLTQAFGVRLADWRAELQRTFKGE